jgi:LacI family transcriptional regulator
MTTTIEYSKRITLKDVAAHAELSVAAVSMALRQHPSLPLVTINRVRAIADELGYTPDPMLCALAVHRSQMRPRRTLGVIALVSNGATRDGWLELPGMARILAGAKARAHALGYEMQPFWINDAHVSSARLNQILIARGIKGVLLAPSQGDAGLCSLDREAFSIVALDQTATESGISHVVTNHYANILRCWRELRAHGFTRVGLVTNSDWTKRSDHQCEAAHTFVQARHSTARDHVPTLSLTGAGHCDQIRAWLRRHRPHAVINGSPEFHAAVRAERLQIPHDVGYVSLDVNEDIPGATGINPLGEVIGEMALDILNSLLQRGSRGAALNTVGTHVVGAWCEGRTMQERVGVASGLSSHATG